MAGKNPDSFSNVSAPWQCCCHPRRWGCTTLAGCVHLSLPPSLPPHAGREEGVRSPSCRKGKQKGEAQRDTAHPLSLLCAGTTAWSKPSTQELQAVLFRDTTSQSTALCAFSSIHPCGLSLWPHSTAAPSPQPTQHHRGVRQSSCAQGACTATSLKQSHPYRGPQAAHGRGAALQPQRGKRSSKKIMEIMLKLTCRSTA